MDDRLPVIIGVGQTVDHWDGKDAASAPNPVGLAAKAASKALLDSGNQETVRDAVDVVVASRLNVDTRADLTAPQGRCANIPGTIADDIGVQANRIIYAVVGGEQPQALINEFAAEIWTGTAECVLLAGGEAIAAARLAGRKRIKLDWSRSVETEVDDRGPGQPLLSETEIVNGLAFPAQTYAVLEHAHRARLGLDRHTYRRKMSELFEQFSKIAAKNPYSQFPKERSANWLETLSHENYAIADPYLKYHVAQDAVNQGAAIILTSAGKAREMDVDESQWIYLHGHSRLEDRHILERPDLSQSQAIKGVLKQTLETSKLDISDIAFLDLYSCFPVPVFLAAEALNIDPLSRDLTVTGGLPFFGGPGNNYSMHAIASMIEKLRENRDEHGLVLANGGYLSKEAAGIYSSIAPEDWGPVCSAKLQEEIDQVPAPPLLDENASVLVETFTTTYTRNQPTHGFLVGSSEEGRVLAKVRTGHRATLAAMTGFDEPIGQVVDIVSDGRKNLVIPTERLGEKNEGVFLSRNFKYVSVRRNGHILEVTLERPEAYNALFSAAHFELHEIWDDFERDKDLWVGIITGRGDKAFCAGNDLKVTAKGGNMSMPRTGFAGLCNRFGQEKPVIAAVNGVAMGGGLEITLSCDLAVAAPQARFAMPEVKVGLFAAAGGVQRLTRQIGRKAAMELILTGREFDAKEALELGVINIVTDNRDVMKTARELADQITKASPSAVRATKQALNVLEEAEGLEGALKSNTAIFQRLMKTDDFREGPMAFSEKRSPNWSNS